MMMEDANVKAEDASAESSTPQTEAAFWFRKAGLEMVPQSENGPDNPEPVTADADVSDLATSLQLTVERLNHELEAIKQRKSKLKMRPEEELEEKVFDVVVAAVNEEFFETIPGIPLINLIMLARKNKVTTVKEPGDRFVFCGTSKGIEDTRKALLELKEEKCVSKKSKNLDKEIMLAKRHIRNVLAGKPADYVRSAGRPKGSQNKNKQSDDDSEAVPENTQVDEAPTPSGRRISSRLSGKPRKSFVAMAYGDTRVKSEPVEGGDMNESLNASDDALSEDDQEENEEDGQSRRKRRKVTGTPPVLKLSENSWRCSLCEFETSESVDAIHDHMKTHESNPGPYECDICFKKIKYLKLYGRHRVSHFQANGLMSEASMILHKKQLQLLEREETLTGKLLQQLEEYDAQCIINTQNTENDGEEADVAEDNDDTAHMSLCEECGMKFNSTTSLKVHMKRIHDKKSGKLPRKSLATEENKLTCPHCSFVCFRVQNLTRHLTSHKKPDLYQCDQCDYTHKSRAEVLRHQRNAHQEATITCDHCPKKFRNKVILNAHVKMKHTKEYTRSCDHCGKVMANKMLLQKHIQTYHTGSDKQSRVMCIKCGRMLASPKKLEEHMEQVHSVDAAEAEEEILSELLEVVDEEVDGKSNQTFRCRRCTYTNRGAREVRRHIVRVHMDRSHKCDQCDKSFPVEKMLKKHVQVQHLGIEKKQCDDCKKWFQNNAYLTAHMKRVHTTEKKFTCEVCHRAFYDKRNYQMHQELHIPEDERVFRFACDFCGKQFRHQSSYDYHMKEHSGERQFPCEDCGAAFRTKTSRDTHQVIHSDEKPFGCDICDKSFKLKKYLDIHVLTHSTDKYACTLCWRVFARKEALEKHVCRFVVGRDVQGKPPHYISTRYNVMVEGEEGEEGAVMEEKAEEGEEGEAAEEGAGSEATLQRYLCTNCGVTFLEFDEASNHQCAQSNSALPEESGEISAPVDEEEAGNGELQPTTSGDMILGGAQVLVNGEPLQRVVVAPTHQVALDDGSSNESQHVMQLDHVLANVSGQTVLIAADDQMDTSPSLSLLTGSSEQTQVMGGVGDMPAMEQQDPVDSKQVAALGLPGEDGEDGMQNIEMYMCGLCNNLFASQSDINQHMLQHSVEETEAAPSLLPDNQLEAATSNSLDPTGQGNCLLQPEEGGLEEMTNL